MAIPNVSFRSYRGKSSNNNSRYCDIYSSVKFGSAGYVLEDEMNEVQWIQAEQRAKSIRAMMSGGFIRDPKFVTFTKSGTDVKININSGDLVSIGGYVVELQAASNVVCSNGDDLYAILKFKSVRIGNDPRINRETTRRIQPVITYSSVLPAGATSFGTDDNYFRIFNPQNIDQDDSIDIYACKICKVINGGDNLKFYRAEYFQVPVKGAIRSTFSDTTLPVNEATLKFDNTTKVLISGETATQNLPTWHGNAHIDEKDYTVNAGLAADCLWNPATKFYVQIDDGSHTPGSIVTWTNNTTIDGLIIDIANKLSPGAKISLIDDVIATPDVAFTGESDYILKASLKIQNGLRPTEGTTFTKPLAPQEFYNTFTVNEKGVVTSAKKATTLADMGITEFNTIDAKDWNFLRYDEFNSQSWIAKAGIISNLDKNFVYSTDDGILNGSVAGQTYYPTDNTRLNYNGFFYATKIFNAVYNDLAELFEKEDVEECIEPGDVVCCTSEGKFTKSKVANSKLVVGVVSDTYGHLLGGTGTAIDKTNFVPIGLSGRVNVKVIGKVEKGDLLVSSEIAGVAMKCKDYVPGIIIGKALENKDSEEIERISMLILNS